MDAAVASWRLSRETTTKKARENIGKRERGGVEEGRVLSVELVGSQRGAGERTVDFCSGGDRSADFAGGKDRERCK
jgi:hypothetical protein